MAFAIYEYESVDEASGQPIEPASVITTAQTFGAAKQLAASTVYVAVVPDADMRLRIGASDVEAAQTDYLVPANEARGFPVGSLARPYVDGIASA